MVQLKPLERFTLSDIRLSGWLCCDDDDDDDDDDNDIIHKGDDFLGIICTDGWW